jgi:hypothetical protein
MFYVVFRLRRLMIKKRAGTCTRVRPMRGPRSGSTGHGLHRLRGTIGYLKAA